MKGQIAISKTELDRLGEDKLDAFKYALSQYTDDPCAGWYASILRDDIYYFLWADSSYKPSDRYLKSLAEDGYQIPYQLD
jgi:hypothetical protein